MGLSTFQRDVLLGKVDPKNYHPGVDFTPGMRVDRSGGFVPSMKPSSSCPRCNSTKILPMRMPGFTLYECLHGPCRHKWRDSYNKPGQILRPRQLKDIRNMRRIGHRYGRILV